MFKYAALFGLAGLAIATGIIVWSGWQQVAQALLQAGWGIPAVAVLHMASLALSAIGWRALIEPEQRQSIGRFMWFMWVRGSVNNLMPVARIGGEFAAVRLMTERGIDRDTAIASTVVELTLSVLAVFVFILTGALLFVVHVNNSDITRQIIWGILLSLPLIAGLITAQRIGFFGLLSRLFRLLFRDRWAAYASDADRLDRAIEAFYRRRLRVFLCALLQLGVWSLGAVEIWLSLMFLQHPLPLTQAVMIEALIQGASNAAFVVPGALGVQEAGFIFFGGMLGLPHDTATALALMRRGRDLICYAPGLILWQMHEGKKLLGSKS